MVSVKDPFIGRVIADKYEILSRLGAGGMGAVYRARHRQTGGDVAIKFLHGTALVVDSAVKRFELEARNAAQLRHANTIRVMDFGVDESVFYLAMEYVAGRPLSEVILKEGAMSWRRAVPIARQILKSLWEAHEHERRIVHRDIKPANIMLCDLAGERDHVKVLDFGVARSLAGTGAGTQGLIGTPFYMAPELWRGELVDGRTDLYALGCVVFELLAGAPPFEPPPSASDVMLPLLAKHCHDPPPPVADAAPDVPAPVAAWVDALLQKAPSDRPASAREAIEALDAAVAEAEHDPGRRQVATSAPPSRRPGVAPAPLAPAGLGVTPPPPRSPEVGTAPPSRAPATRRRATLAVGAAILAAVGAVALVLYLATGGSSPEGPSSHRHVGTYQPGERGSLLFSYRARVSDNDRVNLQGTLVERAAQALVHDRMNYHTLGFRDPEDQPDPALGDLEALAVFYDALLSILDDQTSRSILEGAPLVELNVYENGLGIEVFRR